MKFRLYQVTTMSTKFTNTTSIVEGNMYNDGSAEQNQYTSIEKKKYKKYSKDNLRECVLKWVLQRKKTSMRTFCKKYEIPRSTILTYMKEIPRLKEIRLIGGNSLEEVEYLFDSHVKEKEKKRKDQLAKAQLSNCYLHEDQEGLLCDLAILMAKCGRGITREEILELINLVLMDRKDSREYVPATLKTVDGLISRNKRLKNALVSAGSLDPARAAQASTETRDSMFTKLENYVVLLHELGICKEKSYCEFKSSCLYNMDECALDTTRRKKKIICSAEEVHRLFHITPEGDGKMNIHITLALTSRADGKLYIKINFYFIFLHEDKI